MKRKENVSNPTPVADIGASEVTYFTVIDAAKGYHQCPLDAESQLYNTFTTPFGCYKYLSAPYGLSSIAEHYNHWMAEVFEGLTGYCCVRSHGSYPSIFAEMLGQADITKQR